ncbi:MAG: hypothetical protein ACK6BN_14530, partial [Pseudanabaena sp.]
PTPPFLPPPTRAQQTSRFLVYLCLATYAATISIVITSLSLRTGANPLALTRCSVVISFS